MYTYIWTFIFTKSPRVGDHGVSTSERHPATNPEQTNSQTRIPQPSVSRSETYCSAALLITDILYFMCMTCFGSNITEITTAQIQL